LQVRVLPVAESHADYARDVVSTLSSQGLRVDLVDASDPLGKRIRNAKMEKIPYVLVVGDDDVANRTVGVNARGADVERDVSLQSFVARVLDDVSLGAAVLATPR
jgi:threonyl-tRNA synthetase